MATRRAYGRALRKNAVLLRPPEARWRRGPRDRGRRIGLALPASSTGVVHTELHPAGVTLELLWTEYMQAVAEGGSGRKPYQYSQFCELYREYKKKLSPVMRQTHIAGKHTFIDFSGKRPRLFNGETGEITEVELFVMVLGASSYTYAEAVRTQTLPDFVGATVRGLEYFGGVTEGRHAG